MGRIINPRMEVRFLGFEDFTLTKSTPTTNKYLYMDFDIRKDFEDEPNEAEITIYNLAEGNRRRISDFAGQSAPVEIYLTPSGVDELVRAYKGEVDWCGHESTRPGFETTVHFTSQKEQHRSIQIDQKTFPKGTPATDVITFLINQIGMPSETPTLPSTPLLKAESFSGPAFVLLRRYVQYMGLHCFITDGVLKIASVFEPQNPTVYPIEKRLLLEEPEETTRISAQDVELMMNDEFSGMGKQARRNRKSKRKKKQSKLVGNSDYIEYEAVDKTIKGLSVPVLLQPDRQPDEVIHLPEYPRLKDRYFRIREHHMHGNNYGGAWTSDLDCDEYEGAGDDPELGL